jgi:hypothetical protein
MKRYTLRAAIHDSKIFNQLRREYRRTKKSRRMGTTNSLRVRAARFLSDRYVYRAEPGYLSEVVALGMIVFIAVWPIILLVHTMAAPR